MTAVNDVALEKSLVVVDSPDRSDVQFLEDRLDEFNLSQSGITDVQLLGIFIRDDRNEIVAGLYGWTWGSCCEVKTLWVHEQYRGLGWGTRLMTVAEAEARARGARQMVLSTHSFQAPDFYRRLGFEPILYIDEYPRGHQGIFLRKGLN